MNSTNHQIIIHVKNKSTISIKIINILYKLTLKLLTDKSISRCFSEKGCHYLPGNDAGGMLGEMQSRCSFAKVTLLGSTQPGGNAGGMVRPVARASHSCLQCSFRHHLKVMV